MTGRTRVAVHGGVATLAAASALGSVFDGLGWLLPVTGVVIVVVLANELVRWSPLPSALGPLLAAIGVTGYVTWLYGGGTAHAKVIPTSRSLRVLGDTARDGFHDMRTLGTPVPTHHGLVLMAVVGVAGVALIVDLFAVTMRRAALAGLPLLTIFALCTSVAKHGAGWIPFVIGTAGYLWLLLADSRDRLARWGRPLGFDRDARPHFSWSDTEVMPSPLSVMGRRIGLAAIAVGVIVPLAIPGLRGGVPHGGGDGFGFGGNGSSSAVTLNPIVTIRAQLTATRSQNVLSVQTDDQTPGYLRLTALDQFDGTAFSPSTLEQPAEAQVSRGIDAPAVEGSSHTTQIAVQGLQVHWLPLPTQVISVDVPGDWRYDRGSNTVFSARSDTNGLSYSASSIRPNPSAAALEQATTTDPSFQKFTNLPTIPQDVKTLTTHVTESAATPFDKAVAIQRFLTSSPFVYDINVQASAGTNALEDFLLKTHRGFCQQYASAMAVMARLVNIPSRVAVGFTAGVKQPDGRWLVTTHDAHAWPELYFSGFGWLPFEPTPRADGQAVAPDYTITTVPTTPDGGAKGGKNGSGSTARSQPAKSKNVRLDETADANTGNAAPGPAATTPSSHSGRRLAGYIAAGLLALLLVSPSIVRGVTRRRRWRHATTAAERATAAWAELRASAIDARAGWVDDLTPRATARVLRAEAGGLATSEIRALDRLVDAVQQAWYSSGRSPAGTDGLQDDVEAIRTAMLADSTFAERFVLRAWPRSTLRAAREATSRVGEILDAFDMGAARLRARMGFGTSAG
jgi:transglutaminase-like putative cysteine protease